MAAGLFIPSRFDVDQARADLNRIKSDAKAAGEQIRAEFLKGSKSAGDFLKELRVINQRTIAAAREAQQRNLLDPRGFQAIKREADRAFNQAILPALVQMRREGKENTEEFLRLQRAIKNVGTAGRTSGREVKDGFMQQFANLPGLIRGSLAAGVLAAFTYIAGQVIQVFRGMVRGIQELLQTAGRVAQSQESFFALTAARGLSAAKTIEELRKGTRGLVTDFELMQRANFALQAGLPVTEEGLGRLAEVSRRLARATGRDATEAFQRLINGIVKGEQNVLEELGLFSRLTDVLKEWERQTGRNSDALTQQQKILLFYNAVMAEAERKVADLGEESLHAGDRLAQATTMMSNFRDATLKAIADTPKLVSLLDSIGTSAENGADKVQDLANKIGALVDTILQSPVLSALFGIAKFEARVFGRVAGGALGVGSEEFRANLARRENEQALQRNRQELEAARKALANLQRQQTAAPAEPDQEAIRKAKQLAEQRLRIEEQLADQLARIMLDSVDMELRALNELESAYRATGKALTGEAADNLEALRQFAVSRGDLDALSKELAKLGEQKPSAETLKAYQDLAMRIEAMRDRVKESVPLTEQLNDLLERLGKQSKAIEAESSIADLRAELERRQLELSQAFKIGDIDRTTFEEQGKKAVDAFVQAAAARAREIGAQGNTELQAAILALIPDPSKETDPARERQERLRDLREQARSMEENARAAARLANSLGLIGDEAANALQDVVALGAGIARLAGGDLSAIPSVLSSAVSLIGGLFGESPAERERKEALERNTRELRRVADELAGRRFDTGENVAQARDALGAVREAGLIDRLREVEGIENATQIRGRAIRRMLDDLGLSFEELRNLAEHYGIEIFDKNGRLTADGLEALYKRLLLATDALTGWTDAIDQQREREELRADVFDETDDAAARLSRELKLLQQAAPALFEQFFAGADASTAEGRAAIERGMRALFEAFDADQLSLGNLTRDEFLRVFRAIESALDDLGVSAEDGGGDGSTTAFVRQVVATEHTANRMVGAIIDVGLVAREQLTVLRSILQQLGGTVPRVRVDPGQFTPPGGRVGDQLGPPPGRFPSEAVQTQAITIGSVGPFTAQVTLTGSADRATARALGEEFGRGAGAALTDELLGRRDKGVRRAHGVHFQ